VSQAGRGQLFFFWCKVDCPAVLLVALQGSRVKTGRTFVWRELEIGGSRFPLNVKCLEDGILTRVRSRHFQDPVTVWKVSIVARLIPLSIRDCTAPDSLSRATRLQNETTQLRHSIIVIDKVYTEIVQGNATSGLPYSRKTKSLIYACWSSRPNRPRLNPMSRPAPNPMFPPCYTRRFSSEKRATQCGSWPVPASITAINLPICHDAVCMAG
jgi:hypothetical protein